MRRLRAFAGICVAAFALAAIAPAAADARTETFKLRSPAFHLAGFQVKFPKVSVATPHRSGYITRMDGVARRRGRPPDVDPRGDAASHRLHRRREGGRAGEAIVVSGPWRRALDGLRAEDRATLYTFHLTGPDDPATVVAVEAGEIRGFATTGPARATAGTVAGEVYALYVDPRAWWRGIGRVLMTNARSRLVRRGFT
jgi:ribosomal protein S18 acetylase RimI-like enzyme